jgi:hypothetical protein
VPCVEGQAEEDWQALYRRHEARALRTGEVCAFDAYGIPRTTPLQQAALKLLSQLEAERSRSRNNLLGHVVALARQQGYPLQYKDGDAPEVRQALKAHAERLAAARKAAVLAAESVDYAQLEQHRAQGTLTDAVRAGHERFVIEDTVGLTLTPPIYDDLQTAPQREHLKRFTDLESRTEELMNSDRSEAQHNHLLNQRQHRTMQRSLLLTLIGAVFGDEGLDFSGELTGEEIAQRMASFLAQQHADVQLYFERRADLSNQPVPLLRWLLNKIGVKLKSRQVDRKDGRYMVYFLDQEHLATWKAYARARQAHLARQQSERNPAPPKKAGINTTLQDFGEVFFPLDEPGKAGSARSPGDAVGSE